MTDVTSSCKVTADLPTVAGKELLICQFCFLEQAKEFHLRMVSSRGHVAQFEIWERCLYQQHQLHTCLCIINKDKEVILIESNILN